MRSALSAYGFALDPDVLDEWRETALWCRVCGQQRLRGILECDEQSGPRVRLRCPDCSPPGEQDMFRFMPPPTQPLLSGRRTLGPALKYTQRYLRDTVNPFVLQALTTNEQRCPHCHQPVRAHLHGLDAPQHPHIQVVLTCTACGLHFSIWAGDLACSLSTNRVIEQFLATSARWIAEPDTLVVQADGPACCFRLTEVERGTRLTVLAHKETLQVLTAYVEEAVET